MDHGKNGNEKLKLCVVQSLLVALFLFLTASITVFWDNSLLVASIGASAFIAFVFPRANVSRPRYLIGGYLCASLWGIAGSCGRMWTSSLNMPMSTILFCVGTVFLTVLSMTFFDFEHPPSVALALSIVLSGRPFPLAAAAVLNILALCLCKQALLWYSGKRRAAREEEEDAPVPSETSFR